jgi:methionyl-tRNA formyltransferase
VDRLIRACTPAPGPWSTFQDERVKLGRVRPAPEAGELAPGELLASKHELLVGTGTHPVALGDVRPQAKRQMSALDWARGLRRSEQDRLV